MNISQIHRPLKKVLALFLSLICAVVVTMPFSAARASAFSPRLSAPYGLSYYTSGNPYYTTGYGMPNCTCYAWGRAYEILGRKPNLPVCNAGLWYGRNRDSGAYPYGRTPKLGAIACWGRHVAVVERISGSTITISESHASGRYFDTKDLTYGRESSYAGTFYGYIYILKNAGDSVSEVVNPNTKPGTYRVDTWGSNLNLRSGPGLGNGVIGQIPDRTSIYIAEVKNGWGKVTYNDQTGWVSMDWLASTGSNSK